MNGTGSGTYYDGQSARPNRVTVRLGAGEAIKILNENGGELASWRRTNVRKTDAPTGILRIRVEPDDGARLEVSDTMLAQALMTSCHFLQHKESLDRKTTIKIVGWSIAACISSVLLAVYGVPALAGRIVPFIPYAVDQQLGAGVKTTLTRQLANGAECQPDQAASDAFATLTERLVDNAPGLQGQVDITILPSKLQNAFALPGGHIMILSGLLESSQTPDELAGVIAHELGHVAERHSMRKLVTESGMYILLGAVLGDFSGSTVIIAGSRAVLSAGYSRDAERAADDYAIAVMQQSGGDPAGLATILERIASLKLPPALGFLSSHPHTEERAADIRDKSESLNQGSTNRTILNDAEWQALKTYCSARSG